MLALLIVNLFVCSLYYLDVLHVQRILNEHTNESCSFYSVLNECLSDTENILYECMWRFLYKDVGVVWVCVCVRVYKSLCMFASVCQRQTCSIRWTLLTLAHFSCIFSLIVPLSLPLSVRILFVIDVLFCAVDFFQCFFHSVIPLSLRVEFNSLSRTNFTLLSLSVSQLASEFQTSYPMMMMTMTTTTGQDDTTLLQIPIDQEIHTYLLLLILLWHFKGNPFSPLYLCYTFIF